MEQQREARLDDNPTSRDENRLQSNKAVFVLAGGDLQSPYFTHVNCRRFTRAAAVFGMIAAGKLKLRIEHTYPLEESQRAHRELEGRKTTGKLLLLP